MLEQAFASLKPEEDLEPPVPEPAPPGAAGTRRDRGSARAPAARSTTDCRQRRPGSSSTRSWSAPASAASRSLNNPGERTIDWSTAEELALASILADGVPIRLTGEDVERGTFSQRHAVFHDANTGTAVHSAAGLSPGTAAFEIHNSPLSEAASSDSSSDTTSRNPIAS